MPKTIAKKFTEDEIRMIPEMYKSGMNVNVLREKMHTSIKKIKSILLDAGIDISDPNCQYRKHKPCGYWNNKEHCLEAAKQCRNRGEFGKKYLTAYLYSLENGWLVDFEQYFTQESNFYGFEDKIHCIYSYEIPSEHAVYIGRTMNLKQRHGSHKRGSFTTQHRTYTDTVNDFCQSVGVELPEPKILEECLNAKESQRQEKVWIEKYESKGWYIINKASTGEGSGSLGATMRKWDYEACREAASLCTSKEDYRKKFSTAHRVAIQHKWIDDFFDNVKRSSGCFDSLEGCIEASKKYKNLTDIKKNYPFLYHKICKNKWNEDVRIANGWEKYGEIKKDRLKDTCKINENKVKLDCLTIEIGKMSEYEKRIYHHIKHYDCRLLEGSVYGARLNFLVNNGVVIGVDTIRKNLEFSNGASHMLFLDELIKYNDLGYPMFHIFDSDMTNIGIVLDKIDNALGFSDKKNTINGRDCVVREIYKSDSDLFLNDNHIQGECSASIYLGAYYKDELVAVMCFRNGGTSCRNGIELVRFAGKINYVIRGIGGKLLKYFIDKYHPMEIISFCDRRYMKSMNDNFYTKNGFIIDSINRPDYMYIDTKSQLPRVFHKLYFNKKKLSKQYGFPITMTETEMAKELGYDRIWNCGLIKYVWKK